VEEETPLLFVVRDLPGGGESVEALLRPIEVGSGALDRHPRRLGRSTITSLLLDALNDSIRDLLDKCFKERGKLRLSSQGVLQEWRERTPRQPQRLPRGPLDVS
jgi:hypothetical protein